MTLDEIIAAITGYANQEELRKALKEKAKVQVYQPFFNDGHGVATAEAKTEKETLEAKVTAAETAKTDAERKLQEWKTQNPDAAKVVEKYDNEIRQLTEKHAAELADREKKDQAKEVTRAIKSLRATLISKGVKEIHANAIVKDDALINRIKPYNGSVRVMQKDKDIAFAENDLDKSLGLLADEVIPTLEPDQLVSSVKRGSGRGTTVGDAQGTAGEKKEQLIEEQRQEVRRKFGREEDDAADGASVPKHRRGKGDAKERLNARLGVRSR